MSREPEMKRMVKWASPPSIRRRIRMAPLLAVAMLTIFMPLLGLAIHLASPQAEPSIFSWQFGTIMWLFSVLTTPIYLYAADRVERAMTAYLLVTLAMYPAALGLLAGALRLSFGILGAATTIVVGFGLLLGFATLPLVIRYQRRNYQKKLIVGHLQSSLIADSGRWNPEFDFADLDSKEWLSRPGCLLRTLPWIGPAIGIYLADIVGRSAANAFIAIGFLVLGYMMMYPGLTRASVQYLEFRRMERELGHKILLAEEPVKS